MEKLVIDRSRWLRGMGFGTLLASAEFKKSHSNVDIKVGDMCCLGFYCKQRGIPEVDLLDRGMPRSLESSELTNSLPSWLLQKGFTSSRLAEANDIQRYTASEREAEIKWLFAQEGVEVEFVG
jgi:hypothetical protein